MRSFLNVSSGIFIFFLNLKINYVNFLVKNISGYYDEKENIEVKRKEMNTCAKEILNFVQTSSG